MYITAMAYRFTLYTEPVWLQKQPDYRVIRGKHAAKPGKSKTNQPIRRRGGAH